MATDNMELKNLDAPIGTIRKEHILKASEVLKKYKDGKSHLEKRLIENEEYWKLNHWDQFKNKSSNRNDPHPKSAWLFNSINNKHADAMDNFPEPNVLPREESDKSAAKTLSSILPVVLENNEFEATYSSAWWDKLKGGTVAYGVFWNKSLLNGLGDIDIKVIDMLNLFWEPGIQSIQDSSNLFITELVENDSLKAMYPDMELQLSSSTMDIAKYHYDDTVDTSDKSLVVDWYYKVNNAGGEMLHYVKYVNDIVLYASEDDEQYADRGFYDHARYPIIFDVLFEEKGTPAGFGYIDIMKDPQMYIDRMDSAILKNALMLSKPRHFVKDSGNVSEEEYADLSKDFVHVSGNTDEASIRQIRVDAIPAVYIQVKQNKIDELKETSGNRDFSQGSTASGVTAASAIAALQEAGSKTSRDMIKGSYRAYTALCNMVIELIRQFYDEPRSFRITAPNNQEQFVQFDNRQIKPGNGGNEFGVEIAARIPVFDIKVKAQKASPFSKIAQNELAKEIFGMGLFMPEMADQALACLDMMDFEGKDSVVQRIQQNGMMWQQIQQMQMQIQQMAAVIAQATGDTRISDALAMQGGQQTQGIPRASEDGSQMEIDSIGSVTNETRNSQAGKARARVASAATPQG